MSPSPKKTQNDQQHAAYAAAWQKITDLTRAGKSFSGRERNCCYLNTGAARFANVSATSGFDFADDARALGLVDWDQDGDLDVWVSNRTAPQTRFLRNSSPPGRHFVGFKLRGTRSNRDAIGARVEIEMTAGSPRRLVRTVDAGHGFLSQSSKRLHFGLGDRTAIASVTVRWPHGRRERIEGVTVDSQFEITEGQGRATPIEVVPRGQHLVASPLDPLPRQPGSRIVLGRRLTPPRYLFYRSLSGERERLDGPIDNPRLVLLWATSCRTCLEEMAQLAARAPQLKELKVDVLALNADHLQSEGSAADGQAARVLDRLQWPFDAGVATPEVLQALSDARESFAMRQGPLSMPASYLFDRDGQLAVAYQGALQPAQITADLRLLNLSKAGVFDAACPFPGRWKPAFPQTAAGSRAATSRRRR